MLGLEKLFFIFYYLFIIRKKLGLEKLLVLCSEILMNSIYQIEYDIYQKKKLSMTYIISMMSSILAYKVA